MGNKKLFTKLKSNKTFIIAEVGVNHNGSIELAEKLIFEAKKSGADAVKFQTFKADNVVVRNASKAAYQKKVTNPEESQYKMLKKLELRKDDFSYLKNICIKNKILFLSTPYNYGDVDFLIELGV
ncbi:MAG: N-acetylneuraminate synthase family protein, partial [Ignavibacteriaceae bacterium]|nr:N-acetylneuraminate synthase family protein [Ignavibacteriaceae bacterium]